MQEEQQETHEDTRVWGLQSPPRTTPLPWAALSAALSPGALPSQLTPWLRAQSWLMVLSHGHLQEGGSLTLGLSGQRELGCSARPTVNPCHGDLRSELIHPDLSEPVPSLKRPPNPSSVIPGPCLVELPQESPPCPQLAGTPEPPKTWVFECMGIHSAQGCPRCAGRRGVCACLASLPEEVRHPPFHLF